MISCDVVNRDRDVHNHGHNGRRIHRNDRHVHKRDHVHRNHDPYLHDVLNDHSRDLNDEDIQVHGDTEEGDEHQRKDEQIHVEFHKLQKEYHEYHMNSSAVQEELLHSSYCRPEPSIKVMPRQKCCFS